MIFYSYQPLKRIEDISNYVLRCIMNPCWNWTFWQRVNWVRYLGRWTPSYPFMKVLSHCRATQKHRQSINTLVLPLVANEAVTVTVCLWSHVIPDCLTRLERLRGAEKTVEAVGPTLLQWVSANKMENLKVTECLNSPFFSSILTCWILIYCCGGVHICLKQTKSVMLKPTTF